MEAHGTPLFKLDDVLPAGSDRLKTEDEHLNFEKLTALIELHCLYTVKLSWNVCKKTNKLNLHLKMVPI